jgi:hypothetical protein
LQSCYPFLPTSLKLIAAGKASIPNPVEIVNMNVPACSRIGVTKTDGSEESRESTKSQTRLDYLHSCAEITTPSGVRTLNVLDSA